MENNPLLQVLPHVRHVEIQDRVVILDFHTAAYSILDPVASSMWRLAARPAARREIITALAQQYDAGHSRLECDFDLFVDKCRDLGLAQVATSTVPLPPPPGDAAKSRSGEPSRTRGVEMLPDAARFAAPTSVKDPKRGWLSIRAWTSLWRISRRLTRFGFSQTYQSIAGLAATAPAATAAAGLLNRAEAAFARAENVYFLKRAPDDCLPRSLALFAFLRSLGIPAEHRIGVELFPFRAHAWVQYGPRVVHDDANQSKRFTTIASIPA